MCGRSRRDGLQEAVLDLFLQVSLLQDHQQQLPMEPSKWKWQKD
jgi:hypothetical protein